MNHYLVSFLGRIADEREGLNLEPMLYQVRTIRSRAGLVRQACTGVRRTWVLLLACYGWMLHAPCARMSLQCTA